MEDIDRIEILRKEAIATYNAAYAAYENRGNSHEALELAHASLYLWRQVGNDQNLAISYWLISRIYVKSEFALLAVESAEKSLQHLAAIPSPADWLLASIHEGWARALLSAGDSRANEALTKAAALITSISNSEDRSLIQSQFSDLVR